jgi:hypothetical protein
MTAAFARAVATASSVSFCALSVSEATVAFAFSTICVDKKWITF